MGSLSAKEAALTDPILTDPSLTDSPSSATDIVRAALAELELTFEEPAGGSFVVSIPGERKLATTCSFVVGEHTLSVNAFVARRPDENHEAVYRWLLERNARAPGVAFALDRLGDIYLVARVPIAEVTAATIDRLLGAVATYADESFNPILELGFATAIRREWAWRRRRGESTANLEAFKNLAAPDG